MRRVMLSLLLAPAAVLIVAPAMASAATQTASAGATQASFSFTPVAKPFGYRNLRITIARAGATLLDAIPSVTGCQEPFCYPGAGPDKPAVRVMDLDGDGEPEVLLDLFTGGAHCCFATLVYRFTGSGYDSLEHNWADPGYRLEDVNHDGRPEFVSADGRFAFRFASFAGGGFPLRVFAYEGGVLRDATRAFPAQIRKDARVWWRSFVRRRGSADNEPLGPLAAWVADQYVLGKRQSALQTLRGLARRGELRSAGPFKTGARFITDVDGFLRRLGYARAGQ